MQQKKKTHFVPVFTSKAGACLTLRNWQEVGVEALSYYLHELLMKPGMQLFEYLPDLRAYCGWQGRIVLNASLLSKGGDGIYSFRSHFDGSTIRITDDELFSIVLKLKPDIVVFPSCFLTYLSEFNQLAPNELKIFIVGNESSVKFHTTNFGSYLIYDQKTAFSDFLRSLKKYDEKSVYLAGEFDLLQLEELVAHGIRFIESDKPANDAINGRIYTHQGDIALLETQMAQLHEVIDAECACPTCEQKFTRAYLHHLLLQTPLLCQRFLIQHNEYFYLQHIRSEDQA
ncbi:hypothetical protein [Legionella micdadei]|uniref:Queuine tRNA-ribosyltransferase n=1 Tax=Legionella micdadei TaxID=451 RepID=A0A098GGK7_LEGMI|nr:hypothetical protein [Legionella micdadei]ARG96991.1 hypothetical protein B6N58_04520 [Legionella micdadei]ARH00754.1 hypothetical protein B6V88_10180 [Legionella micdadei]KTD26704.1 queuine tRNA-ribosyltransferase [Legionella micdadei]NSL18209.1 queuine tRNA-ribosyltransferase [Legionella micdadei]CEG61598.1 Queuine tRNA-ribosyltransferase [Legionella micdadei]